MIHTGAAAALYLGSGAGLFLLRRIRCATPVSLPRKEGLWLAGAVAPRVESSARCCTHTGTRKLRTRIRTIPTRTTATGTDHWKRRFADVTDEETP
jgi:hypothetical protein